MRALFLSVLLMLPLPATASGEAADRLIDPGFEVPDHSGAADRLRERVAALADRLRAMDAGQAAADVDDRLGELFLPERPDTLRRRFARELAVHKQPANHDAWLHLARAYLKAGRLDDAAAAAWRVWREASNSTKRAQGLDIMAEAALAQDDARMALHLYVRALELHRNGQRQNRLRVLRERLELRITNIALDVEGRRPTACVVFNQPLAPAMRRRPEDYARLEPAQDVDVSAREAQICFAGLNHGADLEVVVKAGIQGSKGGRLYADSRRRIIVPDRARRVTLSRQSYVLPLSRGDRLPVTTVNLAAVRLDLYRIADRNLANAAAMGLLRDDLYASSENQVAESIGARIWNGRLEVDSIRNREVTTNLPLGEVLAERAPGVYALVARDPDEDRNRAWQRHATQWLVVSNIGLTTFEGDDGLLVVARRLGDTTAIPGTRMRLIARNNRVLGEATTDDEGLARVAPGLLRGKGGDRPLLLTATTAAGDYNFLRLDRGQLDLADRGVGGRAAPTGADAFLYPERGVYRPGETVRLSALLRDARAEALAGLPLTIRVTRPGGTVMFEKTLAGDSFGGYGVDVPLSPGARAGGWVATAYLDAEAAPIGSVGFLVEDFVPRRLEANVASDAETLRAGDEVEARLEARFFYGAPAADLELGAELTLIRAETPFPAYKDYRFGLAQEAFRPTRRPLKAPRTDKQGKATLRFRLDELPDTSHSLVADLRLDVIDVGGRAVPARLRLPVRARAVEVGLRQAGAGSLGPGDVAEFDVVALDDGGQPVPGRALTVHWVREHHDYDWYRQGNLWRTRVTVTDEVVFADEIWLDDAGRARLSRQLPRGRWRFEVADAQGGAAASHRFHVGWWTSSRLPNVPDSLELSLHARDLRDGEVLRAYVKAPFAGTAIAVVMNDALHHLASVPLPAGGGEIEIPVSREWGPGAYLMVTALRPDNADAVHLPRRAMGLAWFSIDAARRRVAIELEVPKSIRPRGQLTLPIRLASAGNAGERVKLTIAAVDEGVLALTGFETPDPRRHYLGQRRLAMTIRDLYGHLVPDAAGAFGRVRSGGDAALGNLQGTTTRTVESVALYHRDVEVDEDGRGAVTLDLPDFNGRLRLMAVAYGKSLVGGGEADLVVRDDIVAEVVLPRFLAPGDEAVASLSLHNLSGAPRVVEVALAVDGGIDVAGPATLSLTLAKDERVDRKLVLRAGAVGVAEVRLRVTPQGGALIERDWNIEIRPAWPKVSERHVTLLDGGQSLAGAGLESDAYLPGTLKTVITVASRPDFNAAALYDELYDYPYACTEQTISRALPSLVAAGLEKSFGLTPDPIRRQFQIDRAIARVLDRQRADGAFAVWRSFGARHAWVTAYAFDFLTRARDAGHAVPNAAYAHAQSWLARFVVRRAQRQPHAKAYALYVLARIGAVKASDVRYFADTAGPLLKTRAALGHLAAAMTVLGEPAGGEALFAQALRQLRPAGLDVRDYGSDLRDSALLATLLAELSGAPARRIRVGELIEEQFDRRRWFSTQEQAWLLLATSALTGDAAAMNLAIDGRTHSSTGAPVRTTLAAGDPDGLTIANRGTTPVRVIESRRGVPAVAQDPVQQGFEIRRRYFTVEGGAVDPAAVRQNDRLVVLVEGKAAGRGNREALVVDLLPAGLEIENAALGGTDKHRFTFLPPLSRPLFEAARDDRYIAALDIRGRRRGFALAYVVRAVTPGRFVNPGSFVEDMYKPRYRALAKTGWLDIAE